MTDTTITLNPGSAGKNIAVDRDANSPQKDYQYVKPVFGASGTYTNVTSSVGFPVNIVQNQLNSSTVADNAAGAYLTGVGYYDSSVSPNVWRRMIGDQTRGLRVDFPDFVVDSNNSTTSALSSPNTYTGTWTDISAYGSITVNVFADQNSTANGMKFQFSSDGSNADIDVGGGFDYIASAGRTFQFDASAQYFRVVFTTAADQAAFRLQTLLHHHPQAITSIHRADADIQVDRSATLVKSILMAQAAGSGDFTVVDATASGNLKVAVEEFDGALAAGSNLIGDVGLSGARTSGGTTFYKNIDVDETEDQVKGTAGQVYWMVAMNMTASVLYLHIYNATAASVTVGTTAPDLTIPVPTLATTNGAGFVLSVPNGIAFGTAITVACTTDIAATASPIVGPAANGLVLAMGYA